MPASRTVTAERLRRVREHTFAVLENLDRRGLRNHVLVITRYRVRDEDCERLASIGDLKLSLLFTYSGIDDRRIEPCPSRIAAESLATASRHQPRRYRTVLYWRPLAAGLNDSPQHLVQAVHLSGIGDATVPSARPGVPGSRRESPARASPSRPSRHRVGAIMTAWTERRYAVIDVEGNGQHPPDLVELAVVPVVAGEIGEPTAWPFRPDEPIAPMARRVHGISNDMVSGAPEFAERAAEVQAHLAGAVVVAHNAGIDLGVLKRKLPDFAPAEVLDTLKLSRRLLHGHASHRLGALVKAQLAAERMGEALWG